MYAHTCWEGQCFEEVHTQHRGESRQGTGVPTSAGTVLSFSDRMSSMWQGLDM